MADNQFSQQGQNQQELDPQLVSTITAGVIKALQEDGARQNGNPAAPRQQEVATIDLIALFFHILDKFWVVVLGALAGMLLMLFMAINSVPTYTATSKLFIVNTDSGRIDITNLQLGTVLTLDFLEVFKTWEVHELVISELDLPYTYAEMQSMISVSNPEDTRILYISATHPDAQMAADIANAYAKAAKTFIINIMRGEEPSDFSIALEPSIAQSMGKGRSVIMGFMLGSVMSVGLLTLLFVLDVRPRTPEDIQLSGGMSTLAVFPAAPKKQKKRRAARSAKAGKSAKAYANEPDIAWDGPTLDVPRFPELDYISNEAMNTLCTNLSYCGTGIRRIMITSRYASEGKSYVSMNLLRTLSRLGRRVVLLDTDLRASGIQANYRLHFSQKEHFGLSEYLSGMCSLEDVLYQTNIPNAYMIPAGYDAPNPLQLLDTEDMRALINTLSEQFDIVLLDTPPVGVLVDGIAMAKYCDGAVLVVGYQKGRRQEIGEIVHQINQTGCRMLGAVLNGVKFSSLSNKHYYYSSERYYGYYNKKYTQRKKKNPS